MTISSRLRNIGLNICGPQGSCERLYENNASGDRWGRPELQKLLKKLSTDDVVVVWKLIRLSGSSKDLHLVLEKIDQAGAHFQSVSEGIDATGKVGRKITHMMEACATFVSSVSSNEFAACCPASG